jgi:hypothetical protein
MATLMIKPEVAESLRLDANRTLRIASWHVALHLPPLFVHPRLAYEKADSCSNPIVLSCIAELLLYSLMFFFRTGNGGHQEQEIEGWSQNNIHALKNIHICYIVSEKSWVGVAKQVNKVRWMQYNSTMRTCSKLFGIEVEDTIRLYVFCEAYK